MVEVKKETTTEEIAATPFMQQGKTDVQGIEGTSTMGATG